MTYGVVDELAGERRQNRELRELLAELLRHDDHGAGPWTMGMRDRVRQAIAPAPTSGACTSKHGATYMTWLRKWVCRECFGVPSLQESCPGEHHNADCVAGFFDPREPTS